MYHSPDATVLRMKLPGSTGCELSCWTQTAHGRMAILACPHTNCREHHKLAWRALEQRVEPLVSRVPPLKRALDVASRWFTNVA